MSARRLDQSRTELARAEYDRHVGTQCAHLSDDLRVVDVGAIHHWSKTRQLAYLTAKPSIRFEALAFRLERMRGVELRGDAGGFADHVQVRDFAGQLLNEIGVMGSLRGQHQRTHKLECPLPLITCRIPDENRRHAVLRILTRYSTWSG